MGSFLYPTRHIIYNQTMHCYVGMVFSFAKSAEHWNEDALDKSLPGKGSQNAAASNAATR